MARRVGVGCLEHIAGGGIDHDGAVAVRADLRPGLRGSDGQDDSSDGNRPERQDATQSCVLARSVPAIRCSPPAIRTEL